MYCLPGGFERPPVPVDAVFELRGCQPTRAVILFPTTNHLLWYVRIQTEYPFVNLVVTEIRTVNVKDDKHVHGYKIFFQDLHIFMCR